MSLIGDALKRTQQNTGPRPPRTPMTHRPPGMAGSAAPTGTTRNALVVVLVGIIVVGGGALFGLWRLYSMFAANAKNVEQVTTMETPHPPPPKEAPKPKPAEPLAPPPIPDEVKVAVRAAQVEPPKPKPEPVVAPAPAPKPPSSPPPSPPVPPREFPKLILQGVTISGGLREALISGQVVAVGDEVEGAKVIAIERQKVTLKFDGREFTLTFSR
jgi:hypothetical protein